ncbi:hypothetical protein PVAND_010566 [Polypedilum vanderplanki]|nr:hypothetical protein PVAND_010566 [Polypedilum vanderplanki]
MKYTKKCAIIDEHNVIMGAIAVNIQIGKKISFEINNPEDYYISNTNNNCNEKQSHSSKIFKQILKTKSNPITSNEHDCDNHSERQYDNKNMQTDPVESTSKMSQKESTSFNDHRDTEMIDVEIKENRKKSKIYHGLLFIESLKSIKDHHASEYFITYEGFWNDCRESTELSINCILNYLKQFPVICDDEFLKRVQNNYLELKLWEKTNETSEKLIGTTKVSLHQFYIAFKEPEMIEHLSFNKLPVISMDAWCNFISPLSNELFCQGKILLAIGSENQIDYLKLSRNLHNLPPLQRINYPQNEERFNVTSNLNVDPNAQIKSKLTAFIESLSQKLPEPNIVNSFQSKQQSLTSSSSSSSSVIHNSKSQLRKTSDLLDSLQKALQQPLPMSSNNNEAFPLFSEKPVSELTFNQSQLLDDCIKMKVNIEQATNLPKVIVKKCRNKRRNKSTPPQRLEYEPHTFATFEAATDHLNEKFLPSNTIKSHEGIVYCTSVINSCNPEWNENFEVFIKFDILKNPQKKFVVKIWRKASHNPTKIEAAPFEDSVIGFTAIDLSVLLTGLPVLSGFYNIIDFSGRCNGQLKITLKPLDDVSKFRNPESPLVPLMCPLSIDINSSESSNDGSNVLSRTLKRKFTELDEITQRLRARLFDVTGDDPDDEFERDLNTAVTEDEIDNENFNKDDFGWLKQDDNTNVLMNKEKSIEMELNKTSEFQEQSSSKNSSALTRRETVTGCSSSDENTQKHSLFPIDDLFKKYDLDTLINPNIFKNLLDPNCNSDSTPTLVPKTADCNIDLKADNESDVTTISSISNDQIQTIQKALQKTSLHEQQNNSRNDPDGHNNISD